MKLITFFTPSHEPLLNRLLASCVGEFQVKAVAGGQVGSGTFREPGWRASMLQKIRAIRQEATEDFVFADADVVFLRPCAERVREEMQGFDCLFQDDGNAYCTGLFAMRSNSACLAMLDRCIAELAGDLANESRGDQAVINGLLPASGLRYGKLSRVFASPFTLSLGPRPQGELHMPAGTVAFHANWTVGVENKARLMDRVVESFRCGRRVRALDGKARRDFEVVVSRYREDVSWVEPMWGEHATIYDKSGEPFATQPPIPSAASPRRIPLPNIGREFGTYLHHIVTRWETLAERTLFLQGNPFVHKALPWEAYVRSPEPFVMLYTDFWKMDEPFCWGPANDGTRGSILVPDKYAWCRDVIQRVPTAEHSHTWGAQFAADKKLIQRCGLEFWQRLYAIAISDGLVLDTRKKYTNYEIGIMFEFTWPQIMLGEGIE